ncbi:hypothetical protein SLEP1_g8473 [Rubroshorea leprosula]|uniref:Uncharacterized protein n=1 Tax=Rubroshorea leprosula TaxID=152421 RepID=A0AAV5I7W7_9ROSI|nr:hypothetical protein SLEP1_g8473 [Rubroshorea leprosula]
MVVMAKEMGKMVALSSYAFDNNSLITLASNEWMHTNSHVLPIRTNVVDLSFSLPFPLFLVVLHYNNGN